MAQALRTLTPPSEGFGDEPRSEADVLLTAAAQIRAALPQGWTVQRTTEVGGLGAFTNTEARRGGGAGLDEGARRCLAATI